MRHRPIQPPIMRHPSGRPLKSAKRGVTSRPRHANEEPLTPGLRTVELPEAIGFVTDFSEYTDDDEYDFDYERETE